MAWVKMSKSRGNVVLPEETALGVCELANGYEFRNEYGRIVDWKIIRIWRRTRQDANYMTGSPERRPVFLHEKDNPVPCLVGDMLQHPELLDYWNDLLERFDGIQTS